MSDTSMARVILSFPSLISLATTKADETDAPRSWIQLAKTGSFVSKRYGKFSITKEDLSQMLHNFEHVTPKAPTELPIDVDHLSMDPQKPGDGVAAGWMKRLELRENGDELWAQVEWTPTWADSIKKKEYRFISPSFVKNHVHKDGSQIGTTLLAAAITNHPFLEGMRSLTLYNFSALGDLALGDVPPTPTAGALNLAEVGQKVTFRDDDGDSTPELTAAERAQTFVVKSARGLGDDAFIKVESLTGEPFGWYPVTAFAPADAPDKQKNSPLPTEVQQMSDINNAAARFEKRVNELVTGGRTLRDALDLAQVQDEAGAEAYRLAGLGSEMTPEQEAVVSLSSKSGESFDDVVYRVAAERNIPLREAIHVVGVARPDLAEAR